MITRGNGAPLVLVPGIQGRWEWMAPAAHALARGARVITGTLCGDRGSRCRFDPGAGFENFVRQVDGWLDEARVAQASLCGVSYGGLIAVHFAAARPDRVQALVLASAPGPRWRPDSRSARYSRAPYFYAPAFVAGAPFRLAPEILAAHRGLWRRLRVSAAHVARVLAAPISPSRMAQRVRLLEGVDFVEDCRRVAVPALVLTGEARLDRVVPVASTLEYLRLIPHAARAVLPGTGHIGLVTKPDEFAAIVLDFLARRARDRA
jgi:3-oxoadipate enol-lactonase